MTVLKKLDFLRILWAKSGADLRGGGRGRTPFFSVIQLLAEPKGRPITLF